MPNEVKKYEHIDGLDYYFKDVKRYDRLLTSQEEKELGYRIQSGDKDALDELVNRNLKFVISIAKKYRSKTDASFADLISEGNIGLIKAASKFDADKKVRFSCYAAWWIKSAISEYIERNDKTVKCKSLDSLQTARINESESLYDDVNDDFERKMSDLQGRKSAIRELTKCLEERERKIITLFYGLGGGEKGMNLEEISSEMSLTKERVRQIKDDALVKLKCEALCSDEYRTYMSLR